MKAALKLLIGFLLLYWLYQKDFFDLKSIIFFLSPTYIISLFALYFVMHLVQAIRLKIIFKQYKIFISFLKALHFNNLGLFYNFFTPSGVGGDIVKGYIISKNKGVKKTLTYSLLIFDRIAGLVGGAILALLTYYTQFYIAIEEQTWTNICHILLALILLGYLSLVIFSRYEIKILLSIKSIRLIHSKILHVFQKPQILAIFLSVISQAATASFFLFGFMVFDPSFSSYHIVFYIIPLAMILATIPIAPAGIGVGQAGIYFLVNAYHPNLALTAVGLISIMQLVQLLIGSSAYFYDSLKR